MSEIKKKVDYVLFATNIITINTINKRCLTNDRYVMFKSITKLFIIIALANLYNLGYLKFSDKIIKYFPNYMYPNIKLYHIINHTSGLLSKWSYLNKKTGRYVMYTNTEQYFDSKDRYKYVLSLPQTEKFKKFKYNNFTYDILCAIIKKITGQYVDDYLKKIFFDKYNIKIRWEKNFNQPYGAFGLHILYNDLHKLTNLIPFLKSINFNPNLVYHHINVSGYNFFGHTGSGGQYLYISLKYNMFFMALSFDDPDNKPTDKQLSPKETKKIMRSMIRQI